MERGSFLLIALLQCLLNAYFIACTEYSKNWIFLSLVLFDTFHFPHCSPLSHFSAIQALLLMPSFFFFSISICFFPIISILWKNIIEKNTACFFFTCYFSIIIFLLKLLTIILITARYFILQLYQASSCHFPIIKHLGAHVFTHISLFTLFIISLPKVSRSGITTEAF